jgi:transcriptional regulator with XRE-family HTH domain
MMNCFAKRLSDYRQFAGETQQQLADAIQMSQSNVSKSLSEGAKKSFTVEQVYAIAEYFGVSVDWLLGYKTNRSVSIDLRSLGEILAELLLKGDAKCQKISVEETVYAFTDDGYGPEAEPKKQNIEYSSIYFPSYTRAKENSTFDEWTEFDMMARALGNESRFFPLNNFLNKYLQILKIYNSGDLSEESYQVLLKDFLNQLAEN